MKTPEILLASGVIGLVAGGGAALAARAFLDVPPRAPAAAAGDVRPAEATGSAGSALDAETRRALDDLRIASTSLLERVDALEQRIADLSSTRTPLPAAAPSQASLSEVSAETATALGGVELTPAFVASVDQALARIEAREDAEREERRRELQAQRIEERVMRLQEELGLSHGQTTDMRTALLAQETKREALFERMRELEGDPRGMREEFRTIREETVTALEGFLTPAQMELYRESEESDWGRRGDWGGGRPDGDFGGRRRDGGR